METWLKEWAVPLSGGATLLLAIAAFWAIIRDIRRSRPNIKVIIKHTYKFFEDVDVEPPKHSKHFITVDVINRGQEQIRINSFGFIFSDKKTGFLRSDEFGLPRYVQPKDSIQLHYTEEHIKRFKKQQPETKEYVSDSIGGVYKAKIPKHIKCLLVS